MVVVIGFVVVVVGGGNGVCGVVVNECVDWMSAWCAV